MVLASAAPFKTHVFALGAPTHATVVPVAAAAALPGKSTQALGGVIVVEKVMVHVVVAAAPMVTAPDWLVPATDPFAPAPHAPFEIEGVPKVDTICPAKLDNPLNVAGPETIVPAENVCSAAHVLATDVFPKLET